MTTHTRTPAHSRWRAVQEGRLLVQALAQALSFSQHPRYIRAGCTGPTAAAIPTVATSAARVALLAVWADL